uniref:Potassium channel SKOR n=1 Tax=Rhizophora mucronata TaxID=61149 RepID=A0A2P2LLE2_RHIMU
MAAAEREKRKEVAAAAEERENQETEDEGDYVLEEFREGIRSSQESRFNLIERQLGLIGSSSSTLSIGNFSQSLVNGFRYVSKGLVIHPENS